MENHELFADRLIEVGLINGMIRMDLASVAIDDDSKSKEEPKMTFSKRIVMPLDGFLKGYKLQQALIQKLEKTGMLIVKNKDESNPEKV